MSVEKLDTVKLKQEKVPYTLHLNYVCQNVKDYLALAIWTYLSSLPDNWQVHRTQLMEHFDVGRDKLGKALKYLNENKLIEYVQEKNVEGLFQVSQIIVKCGVEFEIHMRQKLSTKTDTALLKNRTTDLPVSGETATTNTILNTNKEKDKKAFVDLKRNNPVNNSETAAVRTPFPRKQPPQQSTFSDPTKQSTSFKPEIAAESRMNPEAVRAAMLALPRHMRPKRYREEEAICLTTMMITMEDGKKLSQRAHSSP